MIKISAKLYINGISYTPKLVQPIKWGNFLDERLDEAYITVKAVKEVFQPMDKVEIAFTLTNNVLNTTEKKRRHYFIANDKATETPNGSGYYTHELYLIEITKYLEMFVVDSLTFTNTLERTYTGKKTTATKTKTTASNYYPNYVTAAGVQLPSEDYAADIFNETAYQTPASTVLTVLPFSDVFSPPFWDNYAFYGLSITVKDLNGVIIYNYEEPFANHGTTPSTAGGTVLSGLNGTYTIEYQVLFQATVMSSTAGVYTVAVVENKYPTKRITCTDAINRFINLARPLFRGESAQFVLDDNDAAEFDKIYLPEIAATQNTLRENLQEIGKIIHGEPRLTPYGFNTYKITYDRYGSNARAILPKIYIENSHEQSINEYCSSIDSSAENIINQLDYAQGAITVPRANAARTVRTTSVYAQITDKEMVVALPSPISFITNIECRYKGHTEFEDITPYVFEETLYKTQLSSYDPTYPYSKAFGIYYKIGGTTIEGLNFKQERPIFPAFANYAIINILESVTGEKINTDDADFYPTLEFRVTYVPYFNVRLTQSKPYVKDFKAPATLIYNQSANVIENKAYGENLKGVVARLGNPEKSRTYYLSSFSQIPKAGDLFDDDYYISTVAVELYSNVIKCTLGLSKDFNRLSAYIGVSSERRLYEVSERAAYERTTVYKEYIVVGDYEQYSDNTLLGSKFIESLASTFGQPGNVDKIDHVIAQGMSASQTALPTVELSVVSAALGNSIVFIWNYQDNYSAGAISVYAEGQNDNETVSGYFQNDYPYTDYYGKLYYYNFDLQTPADIPDGELETSLRLPGTSEAITNSHYFSTLEYQPYLYRKDSREISQFCAEVEFVTNRKDVIIGSSLAANNPIIGAKQGDDMRARLYFLPFELNKFADRINEDLSNVPYIGTYILPTVDNSGMKEYKKFGSSTMYNTTIYTAESDGSVSNAESNGLGEIAYTDYTFDAQTGTFYLTDPTGFTSLLPGMTWYSTDINGKTGSTTSTDKIYYFKLTSLDSSGDYVANRQTIVRNSSIGSCVAISRNGEIEITLQYGAKNTRNIAVPPLGRTVYTKYTAIGTNAFTLSNPTYLALLNDGDVYYSTESDGSSDGTVSQVIYENYIVLAGLQETYRSMYFAPVTNYKQLILKVNAPLPAFKAWAFITPQSTYTQQVQDESGNVYTETYYKGGNLLFGANSSTIPASIYMTAIHDPFERFEVVEEHGGSGTTISGYKYARYDEGTGYFECDEPVTDAEVGDIVFAPTSYNGGANGKALLQTTILGKTSTSYTTKTETIIRMS